MSTLTPSNVASWLRTAADLLEQPTSAPLTVYLALSVSQYTTTLPEAERVAVVDHVASALGLPARPAKVGSLWQHVAERSDGSHHLSVGTGIAGPRLCACGAACTHGGRVAA